MLDLTHRLFKYVDVNKSLAKLADAIKNEQVLTSDDCTTVRARLENQDFWLVSKLSNKQLSSLLRSVRSGKENCCDGKVRHTKGYAPNYRDQNTYWCPFCEFYHTGGKVKFESANFIFDESIYSELIKVRDDSLRYELERYLQVVLAIQ